jgi:Na+:H+ antiporter, NhaA family
MRGTGAGPSVPPEAWAPLRRVALLARRPLDRFLGIEASSGIVLFAAAALAVVWANSPWAASYVALWNAPIGFQLGDRSWERPLVWFVNDGLMTLFFFVAGMEIRREIHSGELSERRRAMLPLFAAAGGMLAPALIYLCIADGPWTRAGWGVPMATDIAFALGVFALLGRRIPASLRVLLLTLAVADDLGAIAVIALFYSPGLDVSGLWVAGLGIAGILLLRGAGVRRHFAYVGPGVVVWAGVYASGAHPTIAGVVVGLLTPVVAWTEGAESMSPADDLIEKLHPYVAYGIMPLFALANAGVALDAGELEPTSATVALAIAAGLVVGKPAGILLASYGALRLGAARLPSGLSFRHLLVLGVVAGVGFTMSLFIAQLAFEASLLLGAAKLGVLGGSAIAAAAGAVLGRLLLPREMC